jgi:hypothetical protein
MDLTFAGFNATNLNSVRLSNLSAALASASDKTCVYAVSGDLYYNNSSGTAIKITSAGAINVASLGTITGDYSSTSAAVSYNNTTKSYTFTQGTPNTTFYAALVAGNLVTTEQVSGGKSVTIQCPTGLAANYSLTLPASLPGSGTKFLTVSSGGVIGDAYDVDSLTLEISTNEMRVKDGGITKAKLATKSTGTSVAAGGVAISGSSGTFSTVSGSYVDVTNLSVTITTLGSPVVITFIPDGSTSDANAALFSTTSLGYFKVLRGATVVGITYLQTGANKAPPGAFKFLDVVAAGTYTYKLQAITDAAVSYSRMVAYEL